MSLTVSKGWSIFHGRDEGNPLYPHDPELFVLYRDGQIIGPKRSRRFFWKHQGDAGDVIAYIEAAKFTLPEELNQAQEQVVWGFYEEEKPLFEQGKKGWHELTSPVTKEEVQGYVDEIEKLRGIVRQCGETFRRYERNHIAKVAPPYTGSSEKEYDTLEKARVNSELAELCEQALVPKPRALFNWPIAVSLEPERDWEGHITGHTVEQAVVTAIRKVGIKEGELLHFIHVGPPTKLTKS